MSIQSILPSQVSNAIAIQPLLESMKAGNDQLPQNSFPIDNLQSIQQNADQQAIADVTLYNAHGILIKTKPNTLIAYV